MVSGGKDFRVGFRITDVALKSAKKGIISKVLSIMEELDLVSRVVLNMKGRWYVRVPNYNRMLEFIVIYPESKIGEKTFPGEYAISFDGKDYRVKVKNGKVICNINLLVKIAEFLRVEM